MDQIRQALNAIVFLYKRVFDLPVSEDFEPVRAKKYVRPPVVMSKQEDQRVIAQMRGVTSFDGQDTVRLWTAAHGVYLLEDYRP